MVSPISNGNAGLHPHLAIESRFEELPDNSPEIMDPRTRPGIQIPPPHHVPRNSGRDRLNLVQPPSEQPPRAQAHAGKPTTPSGTLDLPDDILNMIMSRLGTEAHRLGRTSKFFYNHLQQNLRAFSFPHHELWAKEMLADLERIAEMPEPVKVDLEGAEDPDLTSEAMSAKVCEMLKLLTQSGRAHFSQKNDQALHTQQGFRAASRQYDFLHNFGAGHGAALLDEKMMPELYFTFMASALHGLRSRQAPQTEATPAELAHASQGLIRYLNCMHSGSVRELINENEEDDAWGPLETLKAFETGNEKLSAMIEQPGSRWFEGNYHRQQTLQALALPHPAFHAWMLDEKSPWHSMGLTMAETTLSAMNLNLPQLHDYILRKNSPWLKNPLQFETAHETSTVFAANDRHVNGAQVTIAAVRLGNSAFTAWVLKPGSPWERLSTGARIDLVEMANEGSPALTRWLMQKETLPLLEDDELRYRTVRAIKDQLPGLKETITQRSKFWHRIAANDYPGGDQHSNPNLCQSTLNALHDLKDAFPEDPASAEHLGKLLLHPDSHWFRVRSSDRMYLKGAINTKRVALVEQLLTHGRRQSNVPTSIHENFFATTISMARIDDARLQFHLSDPQGGWNRTDQNFTQRKHTQDAIETLFPEDGTTRLEPGLRDQVLDYLFSAHGSWPQIASRSALENGRMSPAKCSHEYFHKDAAQLLTHSFASGNVDTVNWMLAHQERLPHLNLNASYALALSADSGNKAFVHFATHGAHVSRHLSFEQINALRGWFAQASPDLVTQAFQNPRLLARNSPDQLQRSARFATLDPAMLSFIGRNETAISNWGEDRLQATRDAFATQNPDIRNYVLNGSDTWNHMDAGQMKQTVKAIKSGDRSMIDKIVRNKPGKQWHRLDAGTMEKKNQALGPKANLFAHFMARRGKW